MIKMLSTKEILSNLFSYMVDYYDRERFPDFEAVYQFILKEGEQTFHYYISISKGKAVYHEGEHESPSIKIYSPVSVWLDIASGRLNGFWGLLTRKYRIKGPLSYLRQMNKAFGKKFDIPEIDEKIVDYEYPKKRIWKKPDKVLVINGSPRQEKGFTFFYLQYLLKGFEKAGAEVEVVNIYDKSINIEPCRGCFTCWTKTDGVCVIKDDANDLLEKIGNAYLTVYAFPLYIESIPAKLKALLDRRFIIILPYFIPYHNLTRHPLRNKKERYMVLFSVCGLPEIEHFKPLIETFKGMARGSHTPLIATILRPGAEGLYRHPYCKDYLEKVLVLLEHAGKEIIEEGKVSKNVTKAISKNNIPLAAWREGVNLYWHLKRGKNGG
ncbi:MAG: NAD(P)H-dependent oxidoreductase [Candidatus Thermoplasmatota archaeon]|nr:NAD(P)H-dependent oxidoreductase [Candidatus Thermoplasmatota archaeon]MBU4256021.1 NAD(P)H-dependent oxidoreductase [Candidatus Thermoplasmatota archaeon]MCG2825710.1 NAD(P)H-dependent oxidoreductase [Thermoplasmatales archaeon]